MIRVQKVKGEDSLGPECRCWEPTDSQQLTKRLQESTVGARAKSNVNGMVAGKIDDGDLLCVWSNRADAGVVSEVDDESEAFEGYVLEEAAVPRLRAGSARGSVEQET